MLTSGPLWILGLHLLLLGVAPLTSSARRGGESAILDAAASLMQMSRAPRIADAGTLSEFRVPRSSARIPRRCAAERLACFFPRTEGIFPTSSASPSFSVFVCLLHCFLRAKVQASFLSLLSSVFMIPQKKQPSTRDRSAGFSARRSVRKFIGASHQ